VSTLSYGDPGFGGTLIISLDFELHWGVRDRCAALSPYRSNLLCAREVVPRLLDLFAQFDVAATWATVGLLFASDRNEQQRFVPDIKPSYVDKRLFPYREPVGVNESDDPLHFAPSLINLIRAYPRQEIGTHTFSHYYPLERGQSKAAFAADLRAAKEIALRYGIELRSIVFPRNQVNDDYEDVLKQVGILCYRGNRSSLLARHGDGGDGRLARAVRLADAYAPITGSHLVSWSDVPQPSGLCNLPSSMFLRPYMPRFRSGDGLRLRRICRFLDAAAGTNRIFHLWWHPHNFGAHTEENLAFLKTILKHYCELRDRHGMQSLGMAKAATVASAMQLTSSGGGLDG
jgi:hypothetical protein